MRKAEGLISESNGVGEVGVRWWCEVGEEGGNRARSSRSVEVVVRSALGPSDVG